MSDTDETVVHFNRFNEQFPNCDFQLKDISLSSDLDRVTCRECLKATQLEIIADLTLDIEMLSETINDTLPKLIRTHTGPDIIRTLRAIKENLETFVERS